MPSCKPGKLESYSNILEILIVKHLFSKETTREFNADPILLFFLKHCNEVDAGKAQHLIFLVNSQSVDVSDVIL